MDNFHQRGKYSAQIASHQAELRREEKLTNQIFLSISSLQTDYLNLYSSSVCGRNSERANMIQTKCDFCGGGNYPAEKCFKRIIQGKKTLAAGDLDNRRTKRTPQKCFRCGSEDHLIAKYTKPPEEN